VSQPPDELGGLAADVCLTSSATILRSVGGTDDPDPFCPKEIASGRGRLVWWAGRKKQLARRIRLPLARALPVTWLTLSSLSAKQNEAVTGGSSPSAGAGVGGSPKGNLRASRGGEHYPHKVVGQHELVGQFRSADGLALRGGGKLGPQIFPPLALDCIQPG
jgi:hypothetical protein